MCAFIMKSISIEVSKSDSGCYSIFSWPVLAIVMFTQMFEKISVLCLVCEAFQ